MIASGVAMPKIDARRNITVVMTTPAKRPDKRPAKTRLPRDACTGDPAVMLMGVGQVARAFIP